MLNTVLIQSRALLARQQVLHQKQHKRLARRIHDDVAQQLTMLALQLSMAQSEEKTRDNWAQNCSQWSDTLVTLGKTLRNIISELQPRILDDLDLGTALQWYAFSCPQGVNCHFHLPKKPVVLPPSAANELFVICRDIISEVFAPNDIKEASVTLEQMQDAFHVRMSVGQINPELEEQVSSALDGLSIHERLFCVEGSFETQHDPVHGLAIIVSIPVIRQPVSHAA
jgi:signal transduction histidine kinase